MTRDTIWQEFNRRMDEACEIVGEWQSENGRLVAMTWHDNQRTDLRVSECQREQTAATILAAIIQAPQDSWNIPEEYGRSDAEVCRYAVKLADTLRAELAKVAA